MEGVPPSQPAPESHLSRISTQWPLLGDMSRLALCYGPAIRRYILSFVREPHDADEVAQDFFVRVLQHGLANASPDRGRFRDYLKAAVRNATLTWLERRRRSAERESSTAPADLPDPAATAAEEAWIAEWRRCILDRAWQALEGNERRGKANRFHTVLRLSVEHTDEDSPALAARTKLPGGGSMRADAFRKQLSRARRSFAELVTKEVEATIAAPTRERVEEELNELGLMTYLRGLLPDAMGGPPRPTPDGHDTRR